MEEVTLRNGEIAFLPSGTVIMNVDTAIELNDKLQKPKEQSAEEAMENAMYLLALLFGPEILDKGSKTNTPAKPVRNPLDDSHPNPGEKFYFPNVIVNDAPSAKRHYSDSPYVYVDNYGNVFGTMGECDFRHCMCGTTQKIISGKQRLGYGLARVYGVNNPMKTYTDVLVNVGPYKLPKIPIKNGSNIWKESFLTNHLVNVVRVPKDAILPNKTNTRESRYRAWKNAVIEANKIIDAVLEEKDTKNRIIHTSSGYACIAAINLRLNEIAQFRKVYGEDYLNKLVDFRKDAS